MHIVCSLLIRRLTLLSIAVFCIHSAALSADLQLLDEYLIIAAEAQLDSEDYHLSAHSQAKVVREVGNCITSVCSVLDGWIDRLKLTPTRTMVDEVQARYVVDVESPGPGFVVVNYRFFAHKRKALLQVLFNSNVMLSVLEKNKVVERFDLLRLKGALVKEMECTR